MVENVNYDFFLFEMVVVNIIFYVIWFWIYFIIFLKGFRYDWVKI